MSKTVRNNEPRNYLNPTLKRMMREQGAHATARHMYKLGYPVYMALHMLNESKGAK